MSSMESTERPVKSEAFAPDLRLYASSRGDTELIGPGGPRACDRNNTRRVLTRAQRKLLLPITKAYSTVPTAGGRVPDRCIGRNESRSASVPTLPCPHG